LLEDFEDLAGAFRKPQEQLQGRLRVDVPIGMATGVVMAALPAFLARHPKLELDFLSTDRRVDVVADGLDCVVRAGRVVDETMACRPMGALPMVNVVSTEYVAHHGRPQSLSDLSAHWLINYESNPTDSPAEFEYKDGATNLGIPMRHRITVNNSAAYGAACRAGMGIVQIPHASAAADLENGSLLEILPQHRPQALALNLLYPHRRNVPQRVRLFGDWLAEVLQTSMTASSG
jgi:DNA-binding transcriptional LysR family regulator